MQNVVFVVKMLDFVVKMMILYATCLSLLLNLLILRRKNAKFVVVVKCELNVMNAIIAKVKPNEVKIKLSFNFIISEQIFLLKSSFVE